MAMPQPGATKEDIINKIHQIVDDYGEGGGLISNFISGDEELMWDGTMELYYYSREKYEK